MAPRLVASGSSIEAPTRTRFGIALAVASLAIGLALLPYLAGLIGAVILYVLGRPLHDRLSRRLPPSAAALLVTLLLFGGLLAAGGWMLSSIAREAADAMRAWRAGYAEKFSSLTIAEFSLAAPLARLASSALSSLSDNALAMASDFTTSLLNGVIALLGLYYLLVEGPSLWTRLTALLPVPADIADLLARRFVDVTYALLLGTGLAVFVQGVTVGASFAIVGLDAPMLWGFVTMCVAVLPIFGSALVWVPGSVVLLSDGRIGAALFVAGVGLVIASNIDNVVRMLVYRRVSGIHPLLTLVGAFAGLRVLGFIGVFVGPLLLSYFVELVGVYEHLRRSRAEIRVT